MTPADQRTRELLFYLDQDADDEWRARIGVFIALLSDARDWTSGPPKFIDEVEAAEEPDVLIETLGGVLNLLSELPPHALPIESSRRQLGDIEALLFAVADLSGQTQARFGFQLDGEDIGRVEDGIIDHSLQEGLLRD